jgi:hypothetical protein
MRHRERRIGAACLFEPQDSFVGDGDPILPRRDAAIAQIGLVPRVNDGGCLVANGELIRMSPISFRGAELFPSWPPNVMRLGIVACRFVI